MAKKSWWFHLLKNLIICESKPKAEKGKRKGWRWSLGRFRLKQLPTTLQENQSLCEARDEQRKIAMNVARATAAAAEAAVAAAQAAAEVVRLTGVSRHSSLRQHERDILTSAAIKIQTAFRGYLARKALRALKGVIRIQAIARGRAVRRRHSAQLKRCIHPTGVIHTRRVPSIIEEAPKTRNVLRERSKHECKSQRQWIDSIFSKEEIESIYLQKHEAGCRRERMKQYSFSHRERQCSHILEETIPLRSNERQPGLRKRWAEENFLDKNSKGAILELHNSNTRRSWDLGGDLRIKPRAIRNLVKEESNEEVSSPLSHPRRSFSHSRLKQGTDDCQLCNNTPTFPPYMAVTESARAKMRSMSTPRQRLGYLDTYIEQFDSPCKSRLNSSWSSFCGE